MDVPGQERGGQTPASIDCGYHVLVERSGFLTPVQDLVDRDRSRGRSAVKKREFTGAQEASRGRSKYTPVCDGYQVADKNHRVAFPPRLHFSSSDNDIDMRNDPEFDFGNKRDFGANFTDEADFERCEKTYKMAKELKCQQGKVEVLLDENQNLRRKLNTADNVVIDSQRKLETKQEDLNNEEGEIHTMRRKIVSDEVLVKDLVFENRNKRDLIVSLEKEIKELKKTKFKLLGENAQIRNLAKKISDDSDKLLMVITELKAEKKIADEKIINLLESIEGEKDQVKKTSIKEDVDEDEYSESDDALNEEVNQNQGNPEEEASLNTD